MNIGNQGLRLLPARALLKTGEVDHADWNHRPLLGAISRIRYRLALSLLPDGRVPRLLEVGYGSGVFMPELARRSDELYGIDIHEMPREVAGRLSEFGVEARLSTASASAMPFEDNFFDCLVAVSALEFVSDLDAACAEVGRVLKPEGILIVVTPGRSPVVDLGLKILTGESAKKDYDNRRESLLPTLGRHFQIQKQLTSPAVGGFVLRLYTALKLQSRAKAEPWRA
ncbi:MAG TPA: class I SAM-dependent methyltransferase [Pyrinomonadaceae bacterium]|nr:class I SAM-dependent methyltransferase [Pyrinomonadaceae bacterium]